MAEAAMESSVLTRRLTIEDAALALVLGAMMLLPLIEILLRKGVGKGLSNTAAIVQHLTLVAGMLGAAIAARESRLLTLGSLERLLRGRWGSVARVFTTSVAAAVSALLAIAAAQFVLSERASSATLAYGVRTWVIELALPLGFAAIALRILWNVGPSRVMRGIVLALSAATVLVVLRPPMPAASLVVPAFAVLIAAAILGAPIFTVLGGAGLLLFWRDGSPLASLTVDHYGLVTNATIPTVPLFTLTGYFLAEGGASRRLIRLFKALVGGYRGGPAILVALVCAFFTSFTGASGVTILALGGLLMPVLLSSGYKERTALGLVTGTGSMGLLFPPSLPLIFYAVIAGVDIKTMFLGGIGPGILLVVLTSLWGISQAPPVTKGHTRIDWREVRSALGAVKWELMIPVVAIGALFSGLATPVEAAAVTACYAFVVEAVIYRDLSLRHDCPRVMAEAGVLVGGVLLILGVALGLTNYLAFAEVPAHAVQWVTGTVHSRGVFLLMVNIFLLGVGMLMDVYSATVTIVPLLIPLGRAFGVDPVHLGIIFLANLELGYLHPPVGQNLFLASLRFKQPVMTVFRAVIPMMLVFLFGVILITYVPAMTTALPRWFGR
jgi:C4-dicarboxylate transporter, DctM subunit